MRKIPSAPWAAGTYDDSTYDNSRSKAFPPIYSIVDPIDHDPSYKLIFLEDLPRRIRGFLKGKPFRFTYDGSKRLVLEWKTSNDS